MGRSPLFRAAALGFALCALGACDANFYAQYRTHSVDGGSSALTGAETRMIVNVPANIVDGRNIPKRLICTEPSPDVAQAISFAAKLAGSFDQSKSPVGAPTSGLSAAGQFAIAGASAFAQLGERLAVIQLLRDKMYRACESFANGAINSTSYTLMLARLDKTMTTLLTAEMAAGAFGRGLAAAGGSASAGGNVDPAELQKARDEVKAAGDAMKAAHAKDPKVPAEVDAANKRFDTAVAELAKIELKASQAAAQAGGQNSALGQISKAANGAPAVVGMIHQNFLDDDGLEPLTDACLQAFSGVKITEGTATAANDFQQKQNSIRAMGRAPVSAQELAELEKNRISYEVGLLKDGGPFPYFCATEIFRDGANGSGYVQKRLAAKLDLRKASADLATVNMCTGVLTVLAAKPDAAGIADMMKVCTDLMKSRVPAPPGGGGGRAPVRPAPPVAAPAPPVAPVRI